MRCDDEARMLSEAGVGVKKSSRTPHFAPGRLKSSRRGRVPPPSAIKTYHDIEDKVQRRSISSQVARLSQIMAYPGAIDDGFAPEPRYGRVRVSRQSAHLGARTTHTAQKIPLRRPRAGVGV